DKTVYRAASNLPRTETIEARNLNVEKVLKYKNIMFLQDAFKALEDVFLGSA
ncbi:50S ribosomal protein L4, partial [Candidatus Peregrinibacteria bacterium CG10_big_fil_rev_8_21_14_0_10_44_7]